MHEYCIEAILIAYSVEYVELRKTEPVALAVFEFLKEFRLSLIIEVCVLDVLDVFDPDS